MDKLKEKIFEAISTHISLNDTYTYELTRVKSAFEVGTISLEDFEGWSEKNVDDLAVAIVCALQPQLNDNQKIVLEWLESYADKNSGDRPMQAIFYMWDCIKSNMFGVEELTALRKLTRTEQFEVIAAFTQWGLEQEES